MKVRLSTNAKKWAKDFRRFRRTSHRDARAGALNTIAIRTIEQAYRLTPVAKKSDLPDDPRKKGGDRLLYKLLSARGYRKGKGIKRRAVYIYKERVKAIGAMRAGWVKILRDLGARIVGARISTRGSASKSYGKPANRRRRNVKIRHAVRGSGYVAGPALARAEKLARIRALSEGNRELQKANNVYSKKFRK